MSIKQNQLLLNETEANAEELINFVITWFLNHTNIEDRQFAEYWHAKKLIPAAPGNR
jgi:hemerythrin